MTIVIESDKVARALCRREYSVSAAQRGLAPLWRKEIK